MPLSCKINKDLFLAGETIRLEAGLDIKNEGEAKQISGGFLKIIIKGEEFASVHSTDNATAEHFDRVAHPLFSIDHDLDDFDEDGLQPGFYSYPFEYELDRSLPSSFYVRNVRGYCTIRYSIQLILKMPSHFLNDNEIFELPFTVKALPSDPLANQEVKFFEPSIQQISFCACFDRGYMSLGCALDKTVLTQHDALTVSFVAENDSTVNISNMKVALYQRADYFGRFTKSFRRELITEQLFFPKDLFGTKKLQKTKSSLNPDSVSENLLSILMSDSNSQKLYCTFLIRPDVHHSYNGKRVRITHEVVLTLMTSDFYEDPEIIAPIKILPSGSVSNQIDEATQLSIDSPLSSITVAFPGKLTETAFAHSQRTLLNHEYREPEAYKLQEVRQSIVRFEKSDSLIGLLESARFKKTYQNTFSGILEAMDDTHEDKDLLAEYLDDASLGYQAILHHLDEEQYATIVAKVHFTIDQGCIAEMLARELEEKFTCKYVANACRLVNSSNRVEIVTATAPYVVDMKQNRKTIDGSLSHFDKVLVSNALDIASK